MTEQTASPPATELREQVADAIGDFMARECTICGSDYDAADAVLAVPAIRDAQAAVERVTAECDRIEAAVRANPQDPDFDSAYLAAIGHIRTALNPQPQGKCRRCQCPAGAPDCTHCNCCDVPDQPPAA